MCVQYSLFCMKYLGKNTTFGTKSPLKKNKLVNFDKLINDFCIGIVFILVRKKMGGGVTVEILKRSYLKL